MIEHGDRLLTFRYHTCRRGRVWKKYRSYTVTKVDETTLTVLESEKITDVRVIHPPRFGAVFVVPDCSALERRFLG